MGYRLLNTSHRSAAGSLCAALWLCGCAAVANAQTSPATPGTSPTSPSTVTVPAPTVPIKPARKKAKVVKPKRRLPTVYYRAARPVRAAQAKKAAKAPGIRRMNASVDLTTEIQALKARHPSFLEKLPRDVRRLEHEALPTIDKLPQLASFSYLTTVEEYGNLSSEDHTRLRDTLQSIADISDTDRDRFVQAATTRFEALQSDPAQVKSARTKPLDTFYLLKGEVEKLKTPAPPATTQQLVPLATPK